MSDIGDPYLEAAQVQIEHMIQGRTRLFALGLLGLDLLYGVVHREWLGLPSHPLAVGFIGLSFFGLLAMVIWLRKPRPLAVVNAMGGVATLLAVLGTLVHLHVEAKLWETTHLMLVTVGAGCFVYSLPWIGLNLTVALGGWAAYALTVRPTEWSYFGVDLAVAALLGLLLYFVRKDQMDTLRDLLAQDHRHSEEQQRMLVELQRAMDGIKTLRGLVPICASCKKVRDDRGFWHQVEAYVHQHTEATFTHGLCPRCADALRAEFECVTREPESAP